MKAKYFLLVLLALPSTILSATVPPMRVYVTNNGQLDLLVNNVLIPANPMKNDSYEVQTVNNALVIALAESNAGPTTVKLQPADANSTIQIGSHGNFVDVLRSDKIPIRLRFGSKQHFPKKL